MGKLCRHDTIRLRPLILAALGLWLMCAGGCAFLPFALTTTASLAMPQTASLAMTGVKSAYTTASIASDERDVNTIMRDNMLSLKTKSALVATQGAGEVHVYAYNGDVFAVGTVDSELDRDRVIRNLQAVKGVGKVKGHIRLNDPDNPGMHDADLALGNRVRMSLARYLLHKNAGVDVQAVQGDVCLMGVVGTYAEALDLIQYVESISGARALSLLAIRDQYAYGRPQTNRLYLLNPDDDTGQAPRGLSLLDPTLRDDDPPLPKTPISLAAAPEPTAKPLPAAPPTVNKARLNIHNRLAAFAKHEKNAQARAELMELARQVAQDRDLSISDRLSVAAAQAQNPHAKARIQALLAMF
jgi:osmotically-inducible protein OsmY